MVGPFGDIIGLGPPLFGSGAKSLSAGNSQTHTFKTGDGDETSFAFVEIEVFTAGVDVYVAFGDNDPTTSAGADNVRFKIPVGESGYAYRKLGVNSRQIKVYCASAVDYQVMAYGGDA